MGRRAAGVIKTVLSTLDGFYYITGDGDWEEIGIVCEMVPGEWQRRA